jgi:hypothetical protein
MRVDPRTFDKLTTTQLLAIYERMFGRLDAVARRRITRTAEVNGWDRSWPIAA